MKRILPIPIALAGAILAAQAPAFPPPDGPGPAGPCPMDPAGPGGMHQHGGHGPMQRPGPLEPAGPMADFRALGLTPDQTKAAWAVLDKHRTASMARHQAAGRKDEALRAAVTDPAVPEARLRALHAEAAEARLQALLEERAVAQELDALLTPAQRAKAARIRAGRLKEREAHQALLEELGDPGPGPGPARP